MRFTIVAAPKQRNTDEQKKASSKAAFRTAGRTSPRSYEDRDVRWMVKYTKAKPKVRFRHSATRTMSR
jgi:hypothetical protein